MIKFKIGEAFNIGEKNRVKAFPNVDYPLWLKNMPYHSERATIFQRYFYFWVMRKLTVYLSPLSHRGGEYIKVEMPNSDAAKNIIRTVTGRKWSQTHKCWYVPKTAAAFADLQEKFEVVIKDAVRPLAKTPVSEVVEPVLSEDTVRPVQPAFIETKRPDGSVVRSVIGNHLILLPERETRFKVFIPFDKKGWIAVIRKIPGRAWNVAESYWSVPYVQDSFRRIWTIGRKNICLGFVIRTEIPAEFVLPERLPARKKAKSKTVLNPMQQKAMTALEQLFLLESKSWRTIKTYKYLFKKFLVFHADKKPSSIGAEEIRQYLTARKQDNISDSQYNQLINTLNAFYIRVLKQDEKVMRIERPKKKRRLPNVLSQEDVVKLLGSCDNLKHKTILILVYSGGLRRNELLNLRVTDIDFKRRTLFVKNGKGGKDRYTFLSDAAIKYLQQYLPQYQPKYYLFEGQKGGIYSEASVQRIFEKARLKSGVNRHVTLHGLRHSFATHLVEKGTPLHVVQDLLGHGSIKTTEIYLHISNKFRKELRSPLDDMEI